MKVTTKVLLCDRYVPLRKALRAFLEAEPDLEVIGEVGSTNEALAQVQYLSPEVVVLDLDLPGLGISELVNTIRSRLPGCRVLLVRTDQSAAQVSAALQAGASGWILRTALGVELVRAIRSVSRGSHPYAEQHKTV